MVSHIVLFKLKDFSPENAAQVKERLMSMQGQVPSLHSIEVGIDTVRSDRSFDLGLTTVFKSWQDLEAYRVDPRHQEVLAFLKDQVEKSVVVDYEH